MMDSSSTHDAGKTENLKDIKKITLRQFRRNKHINCSIAQEANNGRNHTNSITSLNTNKSDKVDKIPNKVENDEIIVISDETLKKDVTENMKPIDDEIIELSDDEDPLEIVDDVPNFVNHLQREEYSKEELVPNYNECIKPITTKETLKTQDLWTNSAYSNEMSFIKPDKTESPKQVVEYSNTECSKGELVPNSECLNSITTNKMSKNEHLQSNSENSNDPSFKKPRIEESTKQLIEYNNFNTEFSKIEFVPNYSECLKYLQCNSEYSTLPSTVKEPNEEEAPKQDIEYNNAECSKGELGRNYSEYLKTVTKNEMLTKNEDLQSNSEYSNASSFKKPETEEKVELVPNYIECSKPITTNEMMSKNEQLQSNSEYSNLPSSFKKPNAEEAPKQDVECNNTECSKGELAPKYSERSKPFTTDEMFSKTEDFQSISEYSNEPSFKKPKTEESPKGVEYNNTECLNEQAIKNTSIKNERPIEELLFNNSECVQMIDTIELPFQDLQSKIDNINVSATNAEFLKQDPDLNNKECLNELTKIDTNEFRNRSVSLDDDCDGYHSSDFEFIDEDEAKKCPNFLLSLGEAFEKITVNTGHQFKQPQKVNVNKRAARIKKGANKRRATISNFKNEIFSENADIEKPATINTANPVLDENENINAGVMNLCSGENEMLYDYLQTLETPSNEQFNKDYRDTHRMPNDEEYLLLFSGLHSPYPMSVYGANKEINSATKMAVACQEVGFNVNRFVDDSSPDQHQQAKDTEMKIISKYSVENRPRRRRSRRL